MRLHASELKKKKRRRGAPWATLISAVWVLGALAGAARIKLWHYIAGTFLGMLPGVLATTIFGDQIATALEDVSKINYGLLGAAAVVSSS